MLYRKVPKSGDELSILGFGCMRLPVKDGRIDEERATAQIHYAIDRVVNYIDTAWTYHGGESETFLGKALKDGYWEEFKTGDQTPLLLMRSREDMTGSFGRPVGKTSDRPHRYYLIAHSDRPPVELRGTMGARDFP
jgi:predicted aldo/keto reductase-like oxidoreductase